GAFGLSLAVETGRLLEMVDVNQQAVGLAQMYAQRNQITSVDIHSFNVYETLNETAYPGIVSNPPIRACKKVVHVNVTGGFP
ncbi:methyltransferase, partial [Enterococcus faecalis]|uniref:methyltransferase n=1 Tax=Enterococcus faecalis TaxID=1351 RepID=UPI003D6A5B31